MKTTLVLLLAAASVGCGAGPTKNYFPLKTQQFTMHNTCLPSGADCGNTFFKLYPVNTPNHCNNYPTLAMEMHKDAATAYWIPGQEGTWDVQFYALRPDGSMYASGMYGFLYENRSATIIPGASGAPTIIPSTLQLTQLQEQGALSASGSFTDHNINGSVLTSECITAQMANQIVTETWVSKWTIENVATPIYSGPALANWAYENDGVHIAEKWYFVDGLGPVMFESYYGQVFGSRSDTPTLRGIRQ